MIPRTPRGTPRQSVLLSTSEDTGLHTRSRGCHDPLVVRTQFKLGILIPLRPHRATVSETFFLFLE